MAADSNLALEKRLIRLFNHLGIQRTHIAGRDQHDWAGLAKHHPEAIASLSLPSIFAAPRPGIPFRRSAEPFVLRRLPRCL